MRRYRVTDNETGQADEVEAMTAPGAAWIVAKKRIPDVRVKVFRVTGMAPGGGVFDAFDANQELGNDRITTNRFHVEEL